MIYFCKQSYLKAALISLTFLIIAAESPNVSASQKTISTDEIKPGMTGYGLTVFSGTKPEKFKIEVVDVVPNFMLRQDLILIKCHHPVTDKAGVIGGMSGSPIYINGRLAGALAYGWQFTKDALAGVTPIKNMLSILDRKPRISKKIHKIAFLDNPVQYIKHKMATSMPEFFNSSKKSSSHFIPARTPLALSGFSQESTDILKKALAPFNMDPMQGGGGSSHSQQGPSGFSEGDAIGVQLISGDLSATGIGTVTAVRGNNVLAFGHPMFNMGDSFLPVTTARIHTVIASLARSNKMGSPVKEIASLVQDRSAGIAARTDLRASTIPVKLFIEDSLSKKKEQYQVAVANSQWLSGRFIHAAMVQFIKHSCSDVTDVTARITGKIKISGRPVYTISDSGVSRAGLAPLIGYFRPSAIINSILGNPFEDVNIEWVEFHVKLLYGLSYSQLTGIYLTSSTPDAGDNINVNIRLTDYGGKQSVMTVPVKIPESAGGKKIKIIIGGGDNIDPPLADPENFDDFLHNVKQFYPANSLIVSVETETQGLSLQGKTLENLPSSAIFALKPVAGDDNTRQFKSAFTNVINTDTIISGRQTIQFTAGRRHDR